MRNLTIALLSISLSFSMATIIHAHCGSSWTFAPPTFSPPLPFKNCLAGSSSSGQNPTTTTKTVATTIHWTVGQPITVDIWDNGQNRIDSVFPIGSTCTRCFPEFGGPQWVDVGGGVTEWQMMTRSATAPSQGVCEINPSGVAAKIYRFGRQCTPTPTGCGASPDFFGNCPSGFSNNGCSQCCSDAERDACTASGGYYYLRAGTCQSSVCWEQQYECMGWNESWNMYLCQCTDPCPGTPVLVDVSGNGFNLTNKADGVLFDLNGDGSAERISWTAPGSDDAWLAFDRDGDGRISKGAELFGNFTYQPNTAINVERHGFLALGEFDKAASSANGGYGGNSDGKITASDSIFHRFDCGRILIITASRNQESCKLFSLLACRRLSLTIENQDGGMSTAIHSGIERK